MNDAAASVNEETMRHIGGRAGDWCSASESPGSCDSCGERAWCQLTTWRDEGVLVNGFLCDVCRQAIPNEARGWGRDA